MTDRIGFEVLQAACNGACANDQWHVQLSAQLVFLQPWHSPVNGRLKCECPGGNSAVEARPVALELEGGMRKKGACDAIEAAQLEPAWKHVADGAETGKKLRQAMVHTRMLTGCDGALVEQSAGEDTRVAPPSGRKRCCTTGTAVRDLECTAVAALLCLCVSLQTPAKSVARSSLMTHLQNYGIPRSHMQLRAPALTWVYLSHQQRSNLPSQVLCAFAQKAGS